MFVDASAVVAILADEPDAYELRNRIKSADELLVSPIVIYEAVLAIARIRGCSTMLASEAVQEFIEAASAEEIPIDAAIGTLALDAFSRLGKGRHPAALNMGDCFAYACAKAAGQPLLAKGDDFTKTDIKLA